MKWNTLFLDRDGVINVRNFDGYITRVSDFQFADNALEGLVQLSSCFDRIVVVTNQQCIGKKLISRSNLDEIHSYMLRIMEQKGIHIDAILVAENIRGAENDLRKPLPTMGLQAKEMFSDIAFQHSLMVGDTDSDIQFGINLGMKTALVKSKELTELTPDYSVIDLLELYDMITN